MNSEHKINLIYLSIKYETHIEKLLIAIYGSFMEREYFETIL